MNKINIHNPIIPQLKTQPLGYYNEWVHNEGVEPPRVRYRLFKSDVLEWFTLSRWYWPAAFYFCLTTLVVANFLLRKGEEHIYSNYAASFALGWIIWWFAEYSLHRWLFHYPISRDWQKPIWFLMHHLHHKTPSDPLRLVFHPLVSLPVALVLAGTIRILLFWASEGTWLFLCAGGLLNYACVYEPTHYFSHHGKKRDSRIYRWIRSIAKKHMDHHFRDEHKGYSISPNPLDTLFDTK